MNRLRKKSDAKKSQYPVLPPLQTSIPPPSPAKSSQRLPELPSVEEFRTSLILPDLSRRFSLLRTSSGEPLAVAELKSRLADQRARGLENHISEEEEDMILESLGLRAKYAAPADKSESSRQSVRSTGSTLSHSTSTGRSAKRYSNNLFGSGRLRDYSYVRNTNSQGRHASSRILSAAPSEISATSVFSSSHDPRPITPEDDAPALSIRSAPLVSPAPYTEQGTVSSTEYRISKSLGPSVFKRASLALEEAIRELEEDAEDEVVMPRSAPITRANIEPRNPDNQPNLYEGMAFSPDHQARTETEEKRMSPIPSQTLPGYIPGMPRPMTPREDLENDILRSNSITPRAAAVTSPNVTMSPTLPFAPTPLSSASSTNISLERTGHSSTSSFSKQSSRPMSPPFLQRSPMDISQRGVELDSSGVPVRRRPASPLSGPSYQPLTAAAVSTSRPGTPSNVIWTFPASKPPGTGHNRNGSWFSDADESTDPHGDGYSANDHLKSGTTRSLRSPPLPDSPTLDRNPNLTYFGSTFSESYNNRPPSTISGIDLNSPSRPIRSPTPIRSSTPTQSPARSPTSPTFGMDSPKQASRRSSRQNGSSIPFSLSPYNPVLFSPLANSSRSSLESTGSSYHSWEAENKFLFVDVDSHQSAWHDLSFSSQSSSTTPGGSPDADWNAEDVIGSYAGLHKADFSAIQEKLVGAVASKNSAVSEPRERVPSLRRRRPSTSQSNYSLNYRIATPPPQQVQMSPPSDGLHALNNEQISKASALLNSVLDSINTQNNVPHDASLEVQSSSRDVSPSTRRNRDLAEVLFGEETPDEELSASRPLSPETDHSDPPKDEPIPALPPLTTSPYMNPTSSNMSSPSQTTFYNPLRSPSTPHIPQTPEAQADLTREVQRKTDAAMIALRKQPSHPNLSKEGLVSGSSGSTRKKISPNQISTPTLLSASTSVDTIPLRTPPLSSSTATVSPSKIGSRFRKLRGTLRKGNLPTEEIKITPYPLDMQSNPSNSSQPQFARYDSAKLHPIDSAVSASEITRFRVPPIPLASPPASAGPGLKGFMARFRGKSQSRAADSFDFKGQQLRAPPYPMPPVQTSPSFVPNSPIAEDAKSPREMNSTFSYSSQPSSSTPVTPHHPSTPHPDMSADTLNPHESLALKQLFNAANDLGLDQSKLSELLVRSGSISSKSTDWTMLTRNNSSATNTKPRQDSHDERQIESPPPRSDWSTFEDPGHRTSKHPVSRKSSLKQTDNVGVRRPRQRGADDTNTIVRRTIIYPEDRTTSVADLNALVRKGSASRRHRVSAISTGSSNRSVYERVPTPPPPRSSTSRRFSNDSPPVPQLPQSWTSRVNAPGPADKSNAAYDSVYDVYSNEKGSHSAPAETGSSSQRDEHGPAVEVIELANGETIWSIVNGLRDDDAESLYAGRSSFQSEYETDENVQVFVKDHTRMGSKGSNGSFFRKRIPQGKNRPETKIFYTSSAQMGRLIENLSQGMDAGTFNFSQGRPEHSLSATSSMLSAQTGSDVHLTVEERLEHMLGAMRSA